MLPGLLLDLFFLFISQISAPASVSLRCVVLRTVPPCLPPLAFVPSPSSLSSLCCLWVPSSPSLPLPPGFQAHPLGSFSACLLAAQAFSDFSSVLVCVGVALCAFLSLHILGESSYFFLPRPATYPGAELARITQPRDPRRRSLLGNRGQPAHAPGVRAAQDPAAPRSWARRAPGSRLQLSGPTRARNKDRRRPSPAPGPGPRLAHLRLRLPRPADGEVRRPAAGHAGRRGAVGAPTPSSPGAAPPARPNPPLPGAAVPASPLAARGLGPREAGSWEAVAGDPGCLPRTTAEARPGQAGGGGPLLPCPPSSQRHPERDGRGDSPLLQTDCRHSLV